MTDNNNRIRKYIRIFIGIVFAFGLLIGFRYYKTYQLNECIRNIKAEDVSAITLLGQKGFWSYIDSRVLDDDAINEFILMLQKQPFTYYMDDDNFYSSDYGSTEYVIIMIAIDQQKTIQLHISKNSNNGQLFVNADSNYIYNLSAVYKFSNDTGTLFYDWLLEQ